MVVKMFTATLTNIDQCELTPEKKVLFDIEVKTQAVSFYTRDGTVCKTCWKKRIDIRKLTLKERRIKRQHYYFLDTPHVVLSFILNVHQKIQIMLEFAAFWIYKLLSKEREFSFLLSECRSLVPSDCYFRNLSFRFVFAQ